MMSLESVESSFDVQQEFASFEEVQRVLKRDKESACLKIMNALIRFFEEVQRVLKRDKESACLKIMNALVVATCNSEVDIVALMRDTFRLLCSLCFHPIATALPAVDFFYLVIVSLLD
jgi:hypothetical protein